MSNVITFFVFGTPAPGGSKKLVRVGGKRSGKVILLDDCARNKPWRERVAWAARGAYAGPPLACPLAVRFDFVVPRPRGHYGTGRNAGIVRDSAPLYPSVKPDITKLIRSSEDALTGILWIDDALIICQSATKSYGDTPGVRVSVRPMTAAEAPDA
jgi:Holliday junction resolvase RusA-like endonuclease